MPVDKVVINASPLILLFNSDLSFILPALFKEIVVPDAVLSEISHSPKEDKASRLMPHSEWLKTMTVHSSTDILNWDLGKGETEVLSFAYANRDYIPIVDDGAAKKCAGALRISTLGTGSLLILAKEGGLIPSVGASLMKLRESGMWITDAVIEMLQRNAGE